MEVEEGFARRFSIISQRPFFISRILHFKVIELSKCQVSIFQIFIFENIPICECSVSIFAASCDFLDRCCVVVGGETQATNQGTTEWFVVIFRSAQPGSSLLIGIFWLGIIARIMVAT